MVRGGRGRKLIQKFRILQVFLVFSLMKIFYIDGVEEISRARWRNCDGDGACIFTAESVYERRQPRLREGLVSARYTDLLCLLLGVCGLACKPEVEPLAVLGDRFGDHLATRESLSHPHRSFKDNAATSSQRRLARVAMVFCSNVGVRFVIVLLDFCLPCLIWSKLSFQAVTGGAVF